nr:MAG TPA: hypothetical protein [Caudoviricetes sp.]
MGIEIIYLIYVHRAQLAMTFSTCINHRLNTMP